MSETAGYIMVSFLMKVDVNKLGHEGDEEDMKFNCERAIRKRIRKLVVVNGPARCHVVGMGSVRLTQYDLDDSKDIMIGGEQGGLDIYKLDKDSNQ